MTIFTPEIILAAKEHARKLYPEESCGIVVKSEYLACENVAADPANHEDKPDCNCRKCSFVLDPKRYAKHIGSIKGVIHSHPDGTTYPSRADMEGQIASDIPWAIVPLDADRVYDLTIWGEDIVPIIGREFTHGTADCLSLIRDCYRLGSDALAEQDMPDWPYPPADFDDIARQDLWWVNGENLYHDNFAKWGFERINESEIRPGDVFLMKVGIQANVENHGGLLISPDLVLHHLPNRLSRREPAGPWIRAATVWLRYKGFENA